MSRTRNLMQWQFLGCFIALLGWSVCLPVIAVGQEAAAGNISSNNTATLDRIDYAPAMPKSIYAWETPTAIEILGAIDELDAKQLVYLEAGKRHSIASNRVQSIGVRWQSPEAVEAARLYMDHNYAAVIPAIQAAVKSGVPEWQKRILTANLCDALGARGNVRIAGKIFVDSLAPSSPPAMLYAMLPLNWTDSEPNAELLSASHEWLASDKEVARLLGASWLLRGTDFEAARKALLQLQTSTDETIAQLATAQAWRMVPPPDSIAKLPEWLEFRDRLLPPLQLGPTEFIAERMMRTGHTDLAIGQWSRIASQHAERYHRAIAALEAAQRQLELLGRNSESSRLEAWIKQLQATP